MPGAICCVFALLCSARACWELKEQRRVRLGHGGERVWGQLLLCPRTAQAACPAASTQRGQDQLVLAPLVVFSEAADGGAPGRCPGVPCAGAWQISACGRGFDGGSGLPSLPKLKPGTSRPMEENSEVLQAPQHVAVLLEESPVRLSHRLPHQLSHRLSH